MGPGGQYTFQNGGLQLYPATPWTLTVLFICKVGSSAFTFVATHFCIFQEKPQILVHGLFGLDLAYCLSYHLCLKSSRMLGVPLTSIAKAVELLLTMVCFIYIYTFKKIQHCYKTISEYFIMCRYTARPREVVAREGYLQICVVQMAKKYGALVLSYTVSI